MEFYEKLRVLRNQKGFSQEELAERLGVSRQAAAKWESGQSYPDLEHLIALSKLLGITIDRLIKADEDDCNLALTETDRLDSEQLIAFLCRAKKATYAAKGAETLPSRPNSHDLQYIEGDYKYIDTYLGGEQFGGEEAVWTHDSPVWTMNYCGRVLHEGFSGDFLKEVLLNVPLDKPYRGPMIYQKGDYSYHCTVNGSFEWFQGYEEIFFGRTKVYECYFHGGSIK